jgi:surfactin synthase thioesterase subunit
MTRRWFRGYNARTDPGLGAGSAGRGPADGPIRLFGFHHAGGSATAFAGWQREFGRDVDVVPVALPGRGPRDWTRHYADLVELAGALEEVLGPHLSGRYMFYGHSMGAMVAFHLARLRAERGLWQPERLLVGASAAPHLASAVGRARDMDNAGLADWLVRLSATPARVSAHLDSTDGWSGMLDLLREDLRLCASGTAVVRGGLPLPLPIDVFVGADDLLVRLQDAAEWRSYTVAPCVVHVVAGGHFFPKESKASFFSELRSVVLASVPFS